MSPQRSLRVTNAPTAQAQPRAASHDRRQVLGRLSAAGAALPAIALTAGCALLPWSAAAPSAHLLGLEHVAGEPLERRLVVRLRVQNPNPKPVEFKGLALTLDLNNRAVAAGVLSATGTLPAHGETLLNVPVTVSASAEVLQMLGFMDRLPRGDVPYLVKGRFTGGMVERVLGTEASFEATGSVRLPR